MDKPTIRIIRGHQFMAVDEPPQSGKYRDDRCHYERHDGRIWALVDDVLRLGLLRE